MASGTKTTTFSEQRAFAAQVAKEKAATEWAVQQVSETMRGSNLVLSVILTPLHVLQQGRPTQKKYVRRKSRFRFSKNKKTP